MAKYYKLTYQVFGLPMDLHFYCRAMSPEQARAIFRTTGKKALIVCVEETDFQIGIAYAG